MVSSITLAHCQRMREGYAAGRDASLLVCNDNILCTCVAEQSTAVSYSPSDGRIMFTKASGAGKPAIVWKCEMDLVNRSH
ncbi:hypothetical protein RRG08_059944 [Elysia crispata]|uniref:Uncharacterized protein n=1 Tax=Elysia crispata TaxID=231223 RepID=A0AAE0Y7Q8_9GAST|nr:hypothetical protein RRG08_059944 [Elysia crispata]